MQVVKPLHDVVGVNHVVAATYQAVSGAGKSGIEELEKQVRDLFDMRELDTSVFQQRIAFNALPMIPATDGMEENGNTNEENKMISESRKILGLPGLKLSITCVRIPVFNGHSEAVHLGLNESISVDRVRELLSALAWWSSITQQKVTYPADAAGEDMTLVGRIRLDTGFDNGIALWFSSDNLRTGAALNAVRIMNAVRSIFTNEIDDVFYRWPWYGVSPKRPKLSPSSLVTSHSHPESVQSKSRAPSLPTGPSPHPPLLCPTTSVSKPGTTPTQPTRVPSGPAVRTWRTLTP